MRRRPLFSVVLSGPSRRRRMVGVIGVGGVVCVGVGVGVVTTGAGARVPVPLSATVTPGAFELTVAVAVRSPVAVGVKLTRRSQDSFGSSTVPTAQSAA